MTEPIPSLAEAMAEIRRLRARIEAMEAEVAIARGTLAKPVEDEPPRYEHHVPPSAPPHNERPPIEHDNE